MISTKEVSHAIGDIHYTHAPGIITEQSNITKHYYTLISSHCNVAVMAGSTCVSVSRTWVFYRYYFFSRISDDEREEEDMLASSQQDF